MVLAVPVIGLEVKNIRVCVPLFQETDTRAVAHDRPSEGRQPQAVAFHITMKRQLLVSEVPGFLGDIKPCDNLPRHEKLETNGTHVAHAPTLDRLGGAAQLEI